MAGGADFRQGKANRIIDPHPLNDCKPLLDPTGNISEVLLRPLVTLMIISRTVNQSKAATIAFSSDAKGFLRNATVVASILRRTRLSLHIKFYCQGFLPPSFESGGLRVDFLPSGVAREGNFPAHVGSAVFDRMQVMRDAVEWDRCLIIIKERPVL